jgi:TPP-dependent trihydroxycyclohexane-1,2-dione (THcHDO) dehydratase
MAGKGSLRYDHQLNLGAVGATGTFAANRVAKDARVCELLLRVKSPSIC